MNSQALALLDPKGYAKQSNHPKHHASVGESENGITDISNDSESGPGAGLMIERFHNVEKREQQARPAKRAKRDTDSEDNLIEVHQTHKPSSQMIAGSGEISAALKDRNDLETAPTTQVDLTTEATDDEEEEEGKPENPIVIDDDSVEVCLGRIEKALVNAHKVPTPKSNSFHQPNQKIWMSMTCTLHRRPGSNLIIGVVDPTGKDFGNIDPHTAGALCPLMDGVKLTALRLQARLDAREKKPFDYPGQAVSGRYSISINVYARKKYVSGIGRFLSQRQVWLRDPLAVDRNIQICNPHSPKDFTPLKKTQGQSSSAFVATRTIEQVRQDVSKIFDSLRSTNELPEMNPPKSITTPLLPHQKQAVYFLYKREKLPLISHEAGNEEMIVLDGDEAEEGEPKEDEPKEDEPKEDEPKEDEIWQKTIDAKGRERWTNAITGHQTRSEPKPLLGGILADVMGLGKTLNILSLVVGSLGEAGQWSTQPVDDGIEQLEFTKGTLLVCPLSTIVNWKDQIRMHVQDEAIKYCLYQGQSRTNDPEDLKEFDLVITTYQTVGNEWGKTSRNRPNKPLFDLNWFRIVLDEAHQIRNPSSTQSRAACALAGQRRWCVTGTPVQNRLEDLATLIRFLRIAPFHEAGNFTKYISMPLRTGDKDAIPKLRILVDLMTLRRLKDKLNLPDRVENVVYLTMSESERNLYDLFQKDSKYKVNAMVGQKNKLGGKSYAQVLKAVGRLRMLCAHGSDMLSDDDWEIAKGFDPMNAIDLEEDDEFKPDKTAPQAFEMFRLMKDANVAHCAKCSVGIEPPSIEDLEEDEDETFGFLTPCNQLFCRSCIKSWVQDMKKKVGPDNRGVCIICDTYIRLTFFELKLRAFADDTATQALVQKSKFARNLARYSGPHTKTRHLLNDLEENRQWSEAHPDERPLKSVVFSEWTSHLDLIQLAFTNYKVPYTRLDGTMTITRRTEALSTFETSPTVNVILVSLKAGGLGLNLTAASKVYVMEPNYNPAAEQQAIERVHRLGQTRDVQIARFIMSNSIEQSVLELQEKKKKLAEFSVEKGANLSSKEKSENTLADIRSLLR